MKIEATRNFIKNFQKRISSHPNVKNKFKERTKIFENNLADPSLKDHSLKGNKINLRAFSITGDIRVIYYIKDNTAYFLDIGTHNQVY